MTLTQSLSQEGNYSAYVIPTLKIGTADVSGKVLVGGTDGTATWGYTAVGSNGGVYEITSTNSSNTADMTAAILAGRVLAVSATLTLTLPINDIPEGTVVFIYANNGFSYTDVSSNNISLTQGKCYTFIRIGSGWTSSN